MCLEFMVAYMHIARWLILLATLNISSFIQKSEKRNGIISPSLFNTSLKFLIFNVSNMSHFDRSNIIILVDSLIKIQNVSKFGI